ncbi:MAG: hypothetical protein ACLQMO_05735 [Acidobacteriaceae bacterium]
MQVEFLPGELRSSNLAAKKSSFFNTPSVTSAHEVAEEIKVGGNSRRVRRKKSAAWVVASQVWFAELEMLQR